MEESPADKIRCTGCRSTAFSAGPDGEPICDYCGTVYGSSEPECPRCGSFCDPSAQRCPFCGTPLVRTCPTCGTANPFLAPQCVVCGQMLDAMDAMFDRLTTSTPDRLKRIRQEGGKTKSAEEAASQTRLAEMWADEIHRRQEWASAQAERQRQERRIMAIVIGLVALAVTVTIIIVIVGRSTPAPVF